MAQDTNANVQPTYYPPVISVLGHVDHGKTTLLDAIRKTDLAGGEAGGITQRVGASQIEIMHEGVARFITFIDTPGHEAFSNMRSQGVNAADIVLLIVAADDGIMPQTKESIEIIREAKIPFIVVITKADVPGAQIEKVKQQLLRENIFLEGLGGDVPYIAVSAKTGEKVQDLLDVILLSYDLFTTKKDMNTDFLGVVIDSKVDKRRGIVSSIVVKSGVVKITDRIFIQGKEVGKTRALINTSGGIEKTSLPGEAVEILGLTEVLPAGTLLYTKEVSGLPEVAKQALVPSAPHDLAQFFAPDKTDTIKIILKAETSAELEAVKDSIGENIEVVSFGQGDITANDIHLAKDFKAIVVGFHVDINKDAKTIAETDKVFYRLYNVIYEMLDELEDVQAALEAEGQEQILGRATIITSFMGTDVVILGLNVLEGKLTVNDKIRIMRGEKVVGEAKITSIKRGKQDVKDVSKGSECGIVISPELDFRPQDVVLSYK